MSLLIPSNYQLLQQLTTTRNDLNSGRWLKLFTNDFVPSESSLLLDFTESFWPGYAPISLDGAFSAPTKISNGFYAVEMLPQVFTPTADSDVLVYGWWIQFGSEVLFSSRFDFPMSVIDLDPITVKLTLQELSARIACP